MKNIRAFTLVELIVVVTILAILGTIGFVSYSSYLSGVRDANRISQLTTISDGLSLYSANNILPIPDDSVNITGDGTILVGYQGYAGITVLGAIDYSRPGLDPTDKVHFTYYLSKSKKYHQLLAFLEESDNLQVYNNLFNQAHAANDYSNRYPTVYGKELGIILDDTGVPVQENAAITASGFLDLSDPGFAAKAYFSDVKDPIEGIEITVANPSANCKRILESTSARRSGVYAINPTGSAVFSVYCDMTTDGGGWTYATMLSGTGSNNLFDTGNSLKMTSLTNNISDKGTLSDIWVDSENKDIMIVCETEYTDERTKYETPFLIYGYLKSDINDLEKSTKEGTSFASISLAAKWGTTPFTLGSTYASATEDESMYIRNSSNLRVFGIEGLGKTFQASGGSDPTSPYNAPSNMGSVFNGSTNYCMSAIR